MNHSPTPWHVDDEMPPNGFDVFMRVGRVPISSSHVGPGDDSDDRDNARFLVHCVNMHDDLVVALDTLVRVLDETGIESLGCGLARAVLKKAKGVVHEH